MASVFRCQFCGHTFQSDNVPEGCPSCFEIRTRGQVPQVVDYGKVATAAFQSNLDGERERMREALARPLWNETSVITHTLTYWLGACPICGAAVIGSVHIQRHIDWHVRCLQ